MRRPYFWAQVANRVRSFETGVPESEFRGYLTARNLVLEDGDLQINHRLSIWVLPVVAELGTTVVTPQDLMNYKVGDTIMLGNDVSDPLELKVEQITKFKGFPGVSRGNKAIQLTETIEREG